MAAVEQAAPAQQQQQQPASSADLLSPLCRLFLRQDHSSIDPQLPAMLEVLTQVGAAECWHKKSQFKAHLFEVYKMCKLWGANDAICRCALMHSAYSNSFVNLAIFKPDVERSRVAALIGAEAERLVHLFCVVPRQQVIQVLLLDALPLDTADLSAPAGGLTVGHIRSGEPLHVDLWLLGVFLLLTMADFAEQLMSWQDALFSNTDGRLRMEGCAQPNPHVVWPGPMRPGLWMSAVSRMGRLLASCKQQLEAAGDGRAADLVLPPVFAHCSKVLGVQDEAGARDAYWQAVHSDADAGAQAALFARAAELNPYVAEPHLMLAQLHLHAGRWEDAQREAAAALALLADWGTAWDKRMPWDAWVAWTRVCMEAASARSWPATPLGVLSLGLVQGL